jgi:histone acetyltransferase (RNA polymerase elongator complex component)
MPRSSGHFTIPLFIPMQGCPFDCVFCNQRKITGQRNVQSDAEITGKIRQYLDMLPKENCNIEIGFFGGSFTGMSVLQQQHYLDLVNPWLESGKISGIRLSTRPDYIHAEILEMLKHRSVTAIELGVQSMNNEVLRLAGRGHTASDVIKAAGKIKDAGFSLGLQMMVGLPGDSYKKSLKTAKEIISLGADSTRIYPALVVRNTSLENLYRHGKYKHLTLEEAVQWCSRIVPLFEKANVKILRLGLHPSEDLLHGDDLVAGPFHVAFGEMVYSRIWKNILSEIPPSLDLAITIFVNPRQINQAAGHGGENRKMLEIRFKKVGFKGDDHLRGRNYHVDYH